MGDRGEGRFRSPSICSLCAVLGICAERGSVCVCLTRVHSLGRYGRALALAARSGGGRVVCVCASRVCTRWAVCLCAHHRPPLRHRDVSAVFVCFYLIPTETMCPRTALVKVSGGQALDSHTKRSCGGVCGAGLREREREEVISDMGDRGEGRFRSPSICSLCAVLGICAERGSVCVCLTRVHSLGRYGRALALAARSGGGRVVCVCASRVCTRWAVCLRTGICSTRSSTRARRIYKRQSTLLTLGSSSIHRHRHGFHAHRERKRAR